LVGTGRGHLRGTNSTEEEMKMKVTVDDSLCDGHALCVDACPDVFLLRDEDEVVTVLIESPGESLHDEVEQAVASCPKTAISLEG
jgi:ferredoxin